MTKHITVGFDGSPESHEALKWAADEAVARGCGLKIVTCCRIPVAGDIHTGWIPTEAYGGLMESANVELQRAREQTLRTHRELEITTDVPAGSPAVVLVEDPLSEEDLIVLGASSHKGASAFWLGSTPRAIVRHARCPVVVVRGASSRGRPDRIVVGVDGSEAADRALLWAAAEADLHRVTLLVVHAWDYPYEVAESSGSQARDLTRVDAARVLDDALQLGRERCGGDVVGALVEGSPTSAVLDAVRDGDLLALGSRGRGALRAGVFGSTVNSVLDRAAVPVAVVRTTAD
jgi:nucleotide-binding universal stress UspA family protein